MRHQPRAFGQAGESEAERFLRRKGYRILGRNVRTARGELDLVAQQADCLVFVEVKSRRTTAYGGASYAVHNRKQHRLVRLAAQYLAQRRLHDLPCRFDVILCKGGDAKPEELEHIENAFEVPGDDLRW